MITVANAIRLTQKILLVLCCALIVAKLDAETIRLDEIRGELRFAAGSDAATESPKFVVVQGDKVWHLVITDKSVVPMIIPSVGRNVSIHGKVTTHKLENGEERLRIRLEGFSTLRPTNARRREARKRRFEESQKPLSDEEREKAVKGLAENSKVLKADLTLPQVLKISQKGNDHQVWTIQPNGDFRHVFMLPSFIGGVAHENPIVRWEGKLSPRQIVKIARLMNSNSVLELPAEIGDQDINKNVTGRFNRKMFEVTFGKFKCSGSRSFSGSGDSDEVKAQKRRLAKFVMGVFIQTGLSGQVQVSKPPADDKKKQ